MFVCVCVCLCVCVCVCMYARVCMCLSLFLTWFFTSSSTQLSRSWSHFFRVSQSQIHCVALRFFASWLPPFCLYAWTSWRRCSLIHCRYLGLQDARAAGKKKETKTPPKQPTQQPVTTIHPLITVTEAVPGSPSAQSRTTVTSTTLHFLKPERFLCPGSVRYFGLVFKKKKKILWASLEDSFKLLGSLFTLEILKVSSKCESIEYE